jgi:putative hydrolase of the HAD superfamily
MNHLFFDLDNTLWDFDKNSRFVLQKLFSDNGFEKTLGVDFKTFHDFYYKKNDELWHLYYFNKIKKEELRYKRFHDSFLNFGLDNLELSKEVAEEYVKISPYSKELLPGCIDMLEHFNSTHHLHIITNGFAEVQNIIISEEHGLTKPHLDIFRLGERLAKTTSDKCIMIGDNWVSDIEGAIGAGWKSVFIEDKQPAKYKHENISVIKELGELKSLLK